MAHLKIVNTTGYPEDTEIFLDGVKQDDIKAISFGVSVDDIFTEIQIVKHIDTYEIDFEKIKEDCEVHTLTSDIDFTADVCEKCGGVRFHTKKDPS